MTPEKQFMSPFAFWRDRVDDNPEITATTIRSVFPFAFWRDRVDDGLQGAMPLAAAFGLVSIRLLARPRRRLEPNVGGGVVTGTVTSPFAFWRDRVDDDHSKGR